MNESDDFRELAPAEEIHAYLPQQIPVLRAAAGLCPGGTPPDPVPAKLADLTEVVVTDTSVPQQEQMTYRGKPWSPHRISPTP